MQKRWTWGPITAGSIFTSFTCWLIDSAHSENVSLRVGIARAKHTAAPGSSKTKTGARDMPSARISKLTPPEMLKALHPLEQLATSVGSQVARSAQILSMKSVPIESGPLSCNWPAKPRGTLVIPIQFSIFMSLSDSGAVNESPNLWPTIKERILYERSSTFAMLNLDVKWASLPF
jgi:hypothetical protein